MQYLRLLLLSAAVSFGLVWAWVATMPMAFMEPEYASWRAKQAMLDRCDIGEAIILGDSRAAAGILPGRLPLKATNLAVGGGEAVEAYTALRRALACPAPPRLAILSFDPGHFVQPDAVWDRSVRFGLLSPADVEELRDTSNALSDLSIYDPRPGNSLPSALRDRLYEVRFPVFYFSSLAHGGVFLRWPGNQVRFRDALISRGQYYFGVGQGSDVVAVEGHLEAFQPLPILDHYFARMLTLLDAHGIESRFIAMPVNDATWKMVDPAVLSQFAAYLAGFERQHPRFRVTAEIMPHWPDRFFGDRFCHLNPEGAELFSAQLAQRLQEAPPSTQNDAQNGWFNDTGRDASAKVVPISKRGS
nr:hypothetical protein [uncultured Rhodopila sp.]